MLEQLAVGAVMFVAGAFLRPLIEAKAMKLGASLKGKEKFIIDKLEDPEIKAAAINFMKELNSQIGSEDGEKKMNLAVNFIIGLITKTIPGNIDDIVLPPLIRPFAQKLYEGYVKA